jgi:hypothetical protein
MMNLARISCDGACPAGLEGQLVDATMWFVVASVAAVVVVQAWFIYQRQEREIEE